MSLPLEVYSVEYFDYATEQAAAVEGDSAHDYVRRASVWTTAMTNALGTDEVEFEATIGTLLELRDIFGYRGRKRREYDAEFIRPLELELRAVRGFLRRVERVGVGVGSALGTQDAGTLLRSLRKAGLRCCHPHLLSHRETHVAWIQVLSAVDAAALAAIEEIDRSSGLLTNIAGADQTKAGKKAVRLIALVDRLSESGVADRARVAIADSAEQSVPYLRKPTRSESLLAKDVKRAFKPYADYVVALQRLREKIVSLTAQALEQAGAADACEPTWDFQPDSGGGFIEVTVSGGGTRRYPAVASVNLQGTGVGQIRVFAAYGAPGGFDEDLVSLSLDAAAYAGPGTYASAIEGDPVDGTKPYFVYDTRGPDADPYPDGNSFSDWERDILSGTVTITQVDWDPARRTLSGTFTFETEFGNNPEQFKDPRTLTGSFHCCGFDLFDENGVYSPPVR